MEKKKTSEIQIHIYYTDPNLGSGSLYVIRIQIWHPDPYMWYGSKSGIRIIIIWNINIHFLWCMYRAKKHFSIYSAGPKSCNPPPINVTFSELCGENYVKERNFFFFFKKSHISKIIQKIWKSQNYVQNRPSYWRGLVTQKIMKIEKK